MRPKQSGSGLIEVLVAVVVLSVGLLSMLWAQTKSMGYQRTAEFRNMAAQIATEYADRMRANVAGADHYLSSYRYDPTQGFSRPNSGEKCHTATEVCSAAEMAESDQYDLRVMARNSMPGGDVLVTRGQNSGYDIWVVWIQPNVPGLDDPSLSSSVFCPDDLKRDKHKPQCLQLGVSLRCRNKPGWGRASSRWPGIRPGAARSRGSR